jgi:ABC-type microcin C transport system permease subunit YejB
MLSCTVRRLALTIPVLLGVATLVFLLLHLVPGDPACAPLLTSDLAGGRVSLRRNFPSLAGSNDTALSSILARRRRVVTTTQGAVPIRGSRE